MTGQLTPKQKRFVAEYLVDLNGKQAAIRTGYSPKTAEQQASRLLSNGKVAAAVADGQQTVAERLGITHERVLKEFARIAFVDIRKVFDENGYLVPIHELDDDTAAAIAGLDIVENQAGAEISTSGIKIVESHTKKIKLADKKAALDSLAKHLGLLADPQNSGVTLNLNGQVTIYVPDNGRDKRD
jgi:phage terminase small subunit